MAIFLSKEEHHGPKKSVPTEHIRSQLMTRHGIWSRGTLPFSSFSFCRKPCRCDVVLSNRPVSQLGRARRGTCHFFLDLTEESVARPSVGAEDLCSLGTLYCLKRSAEMVFVRSVGCRRPVGSGIRIKAQGAWEQDVCRVHTGILSLQNNAALGDTSAILAMGMCTVHLGIHSYHCHLSINLDLAGMDSVGVSDRPGIAWSPT